LTTCPDAEFTALIERQARFVFQVVYAVLLNAHDAEDAAQETFLKLYRNHGWRNAQNERAFLARVAWRTAIDMRRGAVGAKTSSIEPLSASSAAFDVASPRPGPEQTVLEANQHAVIHSMIDALPEELRVPLTLSATNELTSREIAEILGIPDGTVRTRLQRARQMLLQKLAATQEMRHA
jgi:RNA polymerase sigma-70 factor (ECF subfamily)